jgi:glycosyltransferase involved in cell wall biosynthesis
LTMIYNHSMHILLIHQAFAAIDEPGGTRHHEFARQLAALGHEITIIASPVSYLTGSRISSLKKEEQLEGRIHIFRTYTYPALHKSFFHRIISFLSFMISSFSQSLKVKKVDLVWGTSPPIFQTFTAWLVAKWKRVPFLLEVRDLWPAFAIAVGVLRNPILIFLSQRLEHFLYTHADQIIVNSPGFVEYISKAGGENIRVFPNGSDISFFNGPDLRNATRKNLGWQDKYVILYAGAHGMSNGLEVVLKAAKFLERSGNIHFAFLGDGKEKNHLMKIANELNLNNVSFHDPVPKNEIAEFMHASDACIAILKPIDMYKTTYPNKVFDYMAAEKPVILAIDGVIREVVETAECGVFCEPGNPEAIAVAASRLQKNPESALQMGKNGRVFLQKHFDRKIIVGDFAAMIKKMKVGH